MPKVDFSKANTYDPLPEGKYAVEIDKIIEKTAQAGHPYWKLELKVLDGEFKGRKIFDTIQFTKNAESRNILVFKRFGLEEEGEVNVEPLDLIHKRAFCKVTIVNNREYGLQNIIGVNGKSVFDGYERFEETAHELKELEEIHIKLEKPENLSDSERAGMDSPPQDDIPF